MSVNVKLVYLHELLSDIEAPVMGTSLFYECFIAIMIKTVVFFISFIVKKTTC